MTSAIEKTGGPCKGVEGGVKSRRKPADGAELHSLAGALFEPKEERWVDPGLFREVAPVS
jgi:hypothetical protein